METSSDATQPEAPVIAPDDEAAWPTNIEDAPTEAKAQAVHAEPATWSPATISESAPTPQVGHARSRADTLQMPPELIVGPPPEVPTERPEGAAAELTFMPGPREIPGGNPDDAAQPPGRVPSGDSRSLRRGNEFALIYRVLTGVISRFGVIGTRGQWRVVEYPTSAAASRSYARECSRFVTEGFSDYRD